MLIMCGTALDFSFFCGFCAVFEPADSFAIRVMPHAVGVEWAIVARAEPNFHRLIAHTVETLCADSFKWRFDFVYYESTPI